MAGGVDDVLYSVKKVVTYFHEPVVSVVTREGDSQRQSEVSIQPVAASRSYE